jgi:hypothetical protein
METPRTTGGKGSTPLPAIIPPTAKTAKRNIRSLATLADEICALRARSIFELGELLLEAKAACEPGQWLSWLKTEVDYSDDTASRYMAVAKLGTRFRKLRNLKLAKSTIYALVNLDKEALGLEAVNDPDLTDEDSTDSSHLSAIIDEAVWSYWDDDKGPPLTPHGYFLVEIYSIPEDTAKLAALVEELEASSGAATIVVMPDSHHPYISLDFKNEGAARACAVKYAGGSYSGPCTAGGIGQWRMVGVGD